MPTKKTRPETSTSGPLDASVPTRAETGSQMPARPSRTAQRSATTRPRRRATPRAEGAEEASAAPASAKTSTRRPARATQPRSARPTGTRPGRRRTKPVATVAAPAMVTDDDIRVRAYFLYLEFGSAGGSELDYWIRAERELKGE